MPEQTIKLSAGAIIIKDGKTLLAKRKGAIIAEGGWGSSGGHVEFGETPAEAAIREAKEELGIDIGNLKFIACISEQWYGKQYVDVVFLADIIGGEPKVNESDRVEEAAWFDLNNLPEPLFEPVRIGLDAVKTGKNYYEFKK